MVVTEEIRLQTRGNYDLVDITGEVSQAVARAGVESGTVTVFVPGSTAGVTTIEFEPGLVADFGSMWERLVPADISYGHDRRWGDGNGYSHVRAALLGASLVVPFAKKKLLLGTWQQIVVADFDNRPRSREVVVQIMGD